MEQPVPNWIRNYFLIGPEKDLNNREIQNLLGVPNLEEAVKLRNRVFEENPAAAVARTNPVGPYHLNLSDQATRDAFETFKEAPRGSEMSEYIPKLLQYQQYDAIVKSRDMNLFPFVNTPKKSGSRSHDTTCSICGLELTETPEMPDFLTDPEQIEKEKRVVILQTEAGSDPVICGHKYHRICIEAWFESKRTTSSGLTCPLDNQRVINYYPLSTEGGRRRRKLRKTRKTRKSKKSRNIRKTRK
jgi:hypothetical protein